MRSKSYYLFTFHSTHTAMEAQKILISSNPIIMPTLRKIAATCGISIRIEEDKINQAKLAMSSSLIDQNMVVLYHINQLDQDEIVITIE